MLICQRCNIKYEEGKKFCKQCGSKLIEFENVVKENILICPRCNIGYEQGKKFCKQCGSVLEERGSEEKKEPIYQISTPIMELKLKKNCGNCKFLKPSLLTYKCSITKEPLRNFTRWCEKHEPK